MKKTHKVIIIEPSPVILAGLKSIISALPEFDVDSSFDTPVECVGRMSQLQPDIVIVSPSVFEFSKRFVVRSLLNIPDSTALVAFLYNFVEGAVIKQYDAVVDIFDNENAVRSKLANAIDMHAETSEQGESYNLSEREIEILVSVAKGMSNKEIAEQHNISVNTVISHRKNISRKTGIKSVSGLTVYALLNNLIDQSDVE